MTEPGPSRSSPVSPQAAAHEQAPHTPDGLDIAPVAVTPSEAAEAQASATPLMEAAYPDRRVVMLGASNLTRGVSTVLATAQAYWGAQPVDALLALGHGRSYGTTTNVLGRILSSIRDCGLWTALRQRPPAPLAALVTDIGNDLLYGSSVVVIAAWVEECLDRLLDHNARVVVTQLPVKNGLAISEMRFRIFRTVLFPSCRLTLDEIRGRAAELNDRVLELCRARNIATVEQRPDWYGWDPIHIRLKHWRQAWGEILAPWLDANEVPPVTPPPRRRWFYLRSLVPDHRILLGKEQRRKQPAGRLPDGTLVSLY